jgi:hypothetical protein
MIFLKCFMLYFIKLIKYVLESETIGLVDVVSYKVFQNLNLYKNEFL